ncbi:MAG TPA: hypothetical protein VHO50_06870 [Bacteroidales bacterium]|nr:hypothetical protein [Bacteroidales bacterium]
MDFISTRFVHYPEIIVDKIDPYEDAWGLNTEFPDVIEALGELNFLPGDFLTKNLMEKVKKLG